MHEAALGRSGLLIRGDDDVLRNLQEDKMKLESKLKTAESRVRRLEDLLHRQSQAARPNPGNIFQAPSKQLSDRNDSTISVRSPRGIEDRGSLADGTEVLIRRVQQLEDELGTEKERSAIFEKDLNARNTLHDDIKGQMEEANSTKRDLLENMEALKREFVEERKSLEDEIKRLQTRLEDAEDEIERFGESKENEKALRDEKIHGLEVEIEKLDKEKHDAALKLEGQVEFLRKENRLQRERLDASGKQLQDAQNMAKELEKNLSSLQEESDIQARTLRQLHELLLPGESIPDDPHDLTRAVRATVTDSTSHMRNTEGDLSLLRSDLDLAHSTARELRIQLGVAANKLSDEEMVTMHLREKLSEEKAKVAALEGELAGGRDQLSLLRAQITDGETGSESLRNRLQEAEAKITAVTEELASQQAQVGSLDDELRHFRAKFEESQVKVAQLTTQLDLRTERAKDLTQRLYSQSDRLGRLLERLGFSVERQSGSMVVHKVSRSERSPQNPNDSDPGLSLRRSGTLSSRTGPDSSDLELLYWMHNSDAEAESEKYDAFMSTLGFFDIDIFSETVYKRVKDVEHMARKLQRDARSYREKAHALHKDSHDKIAFKQFKEGDLALFLPTRNQTTGAWAAFNVGFPHYFLREQEAHRLRSREWLVARISKIQERVVDLSKSLQQQPDTTKKEGTPTGGVEGDNATEEENDNPFDLSDGLRWYLIDASEDKPGAPSTPGLAKSTVAANNVEAMADIAHRRSLSKGSGRTGIPSGIEGVSKSLSKSLESRRSSTGSRKALPFAIGSTRGRESAFASETNSLRAAPADTPVATSPTHPLHQQHGATQGSAGQPLSHNPAVPSGGVQIKERAPEDPNGQAGPPSRSPEVRSAIDSLVGP